MNKFVAIAILIAAVGCSSTDIKQQPAQASDDAALNVLDRPIPVPPNPNLPTTLTGTVKVEGSVPQPSPIRIENNPYCRLEAMGLMTEHFVVDEDGGLGNVFVYIKSGFEQVTFGGLETRTFPPSGAKVVLEAKGCRFVPHVLGVQTGQVFEVVNSDLVGHWVRNSQINVALPIKDMRTTHRFATKEVMMPLTDELHPWMSAFVGIVEHSFFSVTDQTGKFEIKGLPPGTYAVEAWHEKLGTQMQIVTIQGRPGANIEFTFEIPD